MILQGSPRGSKIEPKSSPNPSWKRLWGHIGTPWGPQCLHGPHGPARRRVPGAQTGQVGERCRPFTKQLHNNYITTT